MTTIKYHATVEDSAGRKEEFNLSFRISGEEYAKLVNVDEIERNADQAISIIDRLLTQVRPTILAAGPWTCFCGRPGNYVVQAPVMQADKNIEDMPIVICGQKPCEAKVTNLMDQRAQEEAKKTASGGTEKQVTMYQCSQCKKTGTTEEMFKCSRCKAIFYCSKTCQIAHWRACHKKECVPM